MSGGKGSSGTNTVTSTSSPPPQVMAAYQQALNSAQTASSAPLQQYQGNIVAGFTPDQTSAMGTVDNLQGISQPYINQAQSLIQQGTQPLWNGVQQFSPDAVSQYQSPYTQQVLNSQVGLEQNQDAQQQAALQGNAISKGAWGGDRAGVASAVLSGQQDLANNATNAGILNQGYSQGLSEFNTQQQAQLGANEANSYLAQQGAYGLGNLGNEALSTGLTGATAQLQSGQLQQTQNQANLNVPYEQFLQQQAYPFQTAQYYANIAEGIGGNSGGTSSTTSPAASTAAQSAGLGIGAASVLSDAFLKRGGGVRGIGFVPHRGQYDAGGGIPDLSISYVPTPTSGGGGGHNGIPSAPKPYQAPDQTKQVNSDMAGLGKILPMIKGIGSSGGQGIFGNAGGGNAVDPNFSNPLDMGGESNPLDIANVGAEDMPWKRGGGINPIKHYKIGGDVLPDVLSAVGDIAGSFFGDPGAGNQGVGMLNMLSNGEVGKPTFDDGGAVGGMTPIMAGMATQNTQVQSSSSSYQNMSPEQLQTVMMRLPPGSPQSRTAQAILQQKRMMPNVGSQAQGGFSPQHFDDGGDIPMPPSPDEQDLQNELSAEAGGRGLGAQTQAIPTSQVPSETQESSGSRRPDPWLSLATAGFGMASSNSPHWQGAVGEGALAGLKNYSQQQKEADTANHQEGELANSKNQIEQTGKYQQGELGVRKQEAEAKAKELAAQADRYNALIKQGQERIDIQRQSLGANSAPTLGQNPNPTLGGSGAQGQMQPIVSGFPPSAIISNPVAMKAAVQADEQDMKSSKQNETIGNNILSTLDHMESINNKDPSLWGSAGDVRTIGHKAASFLGVGGDNEKEKADLMNGMDKSSNDLATDWQKFEYVPGGRGSVLALKTILASKPGVSQQYNVNSDIINEIRGKVYDMKLGNEVANTYRSAENTPHVADGNVNKIEETLRTLYPTTSMDQQTGRTVFHPENVQAYREAISDAIQNPQKYLSLARAKLGSSSTQQQEQPQSTSQPQGPSPADVAYLRANPNMAAKFESRFGSGSSRQILGGQ